MKIWRMRSVEWRVRAIRGATTVSENTKEAIRDAVRELLDELESQNQLDPDEIIYAIFTATQDLDAIFPAAIARQRPGWNHVALLDVQQMHVEGSLERCIRVLIQVNMPASQVEIYHPYLRGAKNLRPDWTLAQLSRRVTPAVQTRR
jgi:chorismate mutase